jgi:hypothetical protein
MRIACDDIPMQPMCKKEGMEEQGGCVGDCQVLTP